MLIVAKSRKKSCIMYADWLGLLKDEDLCLSDAEIGIVMVAVLEYIQSGIMPKFGDRGLTAVFKTIKGQIDKDGERYDETCKKRSEAAGKRWNSDAEEDTKNTNECKCIQSDASDSDNDNDCEYDNEHNSLKESMCVDAHENTSEDRKLAAPCGFFQNVYLTADEFKKLEAEYGEQKLKKAITLLSARIQKDGKYKDDNHAALIVQWVMKAVEEDEVKELELKSRKKKARGSPEQQSEKLEKAKKAGFDFEFEDIYEKP